MAQSEDYWLSLPNDTRSFPVLVRIDPIGGIKDERTVLGRDREDERAVIARLRQDPGCDSPRFSRAIGDRAPRKVGGVALDHSPERCLRDLDEQLAALVLKEIGEDFDPVLSGVGGLLAAQDANDQFGRAPRQTAATRRDNQLGRDIIRHGARLREGQEDQDTQSQAAFPNDTLLFTPEIVHFY